MTQDIKEVHISNCPSLPTYCRDLTSQTHSLTSNVTKDNSNTHDRLQHLPNSIESILPKLKKPSYSTKHSLNLSDPHTWQKIHQLREKKKTIHNVQTITGPVSEGKKCKYHSPKRKKSPIIQSVLTTKTDGTSGITAEKEKNTPKKQIKWKPPKKKKNLTKIILNGFKKSPIPRKQKTIRLRLDSQSEIENRVNQKKTVKNKLTKISRRNIKKYLVKNKLIRPNSTAPIGILRDIYLQAKLLGDIQISH